MEAPVWTFAVVELVNCAMYEVSIVSIASWHTAIGKRATVTSASSYYYYYCGDAGNGETLANPVLTR